MISYTYQEKANFEQGFLFVSDPETCAFLQSSTPGMLSTLASAVFKFLKQIVCNLDIVFLYHLLSRSEISFPLAEVQNHLYLALH